MKNSLTYFFKTQLTVMLVFNFFLLLAFIPFVVFSFVVFDMLDVQRGMDTFAYIACAVPVIVFFCCGVYYRNARYYYLSSLSPGSIIFGTGKNSKPKTPIVKPVNLIVRYLPVVFPLLYTLACGIFYDQTRFNQLLLLVNIPYNWIFLTPAWYMIFSNASINSLYFPIILSAISYFIFFLGFLLGASPVFNRFFKDRNKTASVAD